MPVEKLTQGFAETAKLPADVADVTFWDQSLSGFGLRLRRETGGTVNKSWIAWCRIKDQKQQRKIRLGPAGRDAMPAAKAREIANDVLAKARLGVDVVGERKAAAAAPKPYELGSAFERYIRQVEGQLRPNTVREIRRHLARDWAPIQHIATNAVSRIQISARLGEIVAEHGPVAANRSRASLSAFFAWCVREGLTDLNPVVGARRPEAERARERVLKDREIAAIWKAVGDGAYGKILRLLLLTGQRRQEVGAIAAEEIDLERRIWLLPASRTKNSEAHAVPLSDQALVILKEAIGDKRQGCLFGPGGFKGWSDARASLDTRLALIRSKDEPPIEPFVIHDLRRTVATGLADIGIAPHIVEAVLNHVSGSKRGVAGVYNRASYSAEKRQALDRWGAHVESILAGEAGTNIVPLRTAP
jgi:integrase